MQFSNLAHIARAERRLCDFIDLEIEDPANGVESFLGLQLGGEEELRVPGPTVNREVGGDDVAGFKEFLFLFREDLGDLPV